MAAASAQHQLCHNYNTIFLPQFSGFAILPFLGSIIAYRIACVPNRNRQDLNFALLTASVMADALAIRGPADTALTPRQGLIHVHEKYEQILVCLYLYC